MPRSVVLQSSIRCERCQLPVRWCVCSALQSVALPLEVDVLIHHRELYRPSSTGHLIHRTVGGSRQHLWRRERGLTAAPADRDILAALAQFLAETGDERRAAEIRDRLQHLN